MKVIKQVRFHLEFAMDNTTTLETVHGGVQARATRPYASKLELQQEIKPYVVQYLPPTRIIIAPSPRSVVADLGGGHGDADGGVLLLGLGTPLLDVRLGERHPANGRQGRSGGSKHHGTAAVGGGLHGCHLGRRLLLALDLGGPGHHEAAARGCRAPVDRHGRGEGRHHGERRHRDGAAELLRRSALGMCDDDASGVRFGAGLFGYEDTAGWAARQGAPYLSRGWRAHWRA
uniref:Uncharacterized protein n=1 Tax=Triticum urartu TaxID=4572 RepID=A0A8R7USX7_TRIUA